MKVLGLAGKAGAGKDYVYQWLKDRERQRGYSVERVAFADGLKYDIEEALGIPLDSSNLWVKPYSPEIRWLLQQWGTELRRAQDEDYWVTKGMAAIADIGIRADLVVITDVRFQNEVDVIHGFGGIVIEIYAHDSLRGERLGTPLSVLSEQDRHASAVIDFATDGVIINNDTPILPRRVSDYLSEL